MKKINQELSYLKCYNCQQPARYEFSFDNTLFYACSKKCVLEIVDMQIDFAKVS